MVKEKPNPNILHLASERGYETLYQIFRLNMFYCLVFIFTTIFYLLVFGIYEGVLVTIVTLWMFLFLKDFVPIYYKYNRGWKIRLLMTISVLFLTFVAFPIFILTLFYQ